jgi:hypothetical protein
VVLALAFGIEDVRELKGWPEEAFLLSKIFKAMFLAIGLHSWVDMGVSLTDPEVCRNDSIPGVSDDREPKGGIKSVPADDSSNLLGGKVLHGLFFIEATDMIDL